jgi:hypothetical protein
MSEPTPSWAERLIQSNQQLANAITSQAHSLSALSEAIVKLAESQMDDELPRPTGFLDDAPGPAQSLDGGLL